MTKMNITEWKKITEGYRVLGKNNCKIWVDSNYGQNTADI